MVSFEEIRGGRKTCLQSLPWYLRVIDGIFRCFGTCRCKYWVLHEMHEIWGLFQVMSSAQVQTVSAMHSWEQGTVGNSRFCKSSICPSPPVALLQLIPGMPRFWYTLISPGNRTLLSDLFYLHSADAYLVIKFPMTYQCLTIRCLTSYLMQNRLHPGN